MGILIELRGDEQPAPGAFGEARALIEASPGRGPLYLDVKTGRNGGVNGDPGEVDDDGQPSRFRSKSLRVEPSQDLIEKLKTLLGGSGVRMVRRS